MRKKSEPVKLKLSNSDKVALIDEEDYLMCSQYTWRLKIDGRTQTLYVATSKRVGSKMKTIRLHRLVMNATPGMDVHHINFDSIDNRKENLVKVAPGEHRGHSRKYQAPAPF